MRVGGVTAYVGVLRVPGAFAFSGAATLVRIAQAMLGLGSVLLLVQLGRSYAVAGLVAGAISIAQGAFGPQVSRLVDRHGERRIVLPQVLVHAASGGGLVAASLTSAPAWLLVGVALVVGASVPQAGALARARWTALLDDPAQLELALAGESLVEEAVFVVGPVLVTMLATTAGPAAGLLAAVGTVVVGTILFLAQRRTEPALRTTGTRSYEGDQGDVRRTSRSALASTGLAVLVGTFVATGVMFGLIEVGVVALSRGRGEPGAAGTMLGLWAAGSFVAGLFYGARRWRLWPATRLQVSTVAMAAGAGLVAVAAASESLLATTLALMVAGTANTPTLITGNTMVRWLVPAEHVTEAYTWLGVGVFAGIAVGAAAGGALIDQVGHIGSFCAAVAAAALAALLPTLGRHRLP